MNKKEFQTAKDQDRAKYITRPYEEIPLTALVEGSNSHLVNTDQQTISFLTMKAGSSFAVHSHENEQVMIVIDGYCDEIIDGKIYRVSKGDVIRLPPNVPHGAFLMEVDCQAIDIFTPPRSDYLEMYQEQNPGQKMIFNGMGERD